MRNRLKGFTLLETVLYIGLFSVILFIVVSFMLSTQESNMRTQRSENIYQSSQFITQHINYTFNKAIGVDETNSIFDNDNGKLSLNIGTEGKSYDLIDSKLMYDNTQISSSNIVVETFHLIPIYKETTIIGVKIEVSLRDKDNSNLTEEINLLSTFR